MVSSDIVASIAYLLNTLTVMSCLFLKVPQIMNIVRRKCAEGIYVQTLMMEITGFSITMLYNFTNKYNVMTYLEYPIILIQVYVLLYYVLKYKDLLRYPIVPIATLTYIGLVCAFAMEVLPKEVLSCLVPFCTPLSGFAKVSYIYGIVKAANADAVSLTTWVISILTNIARIFTVYVDSADKTLLSNFTVSTILSSGVLLTALYYQRMTSTEAIRPPHRKYARSNSHSD